MFRIDICKQARLAVITVFLIIPTIAMAETKIDTYRNAQVEKIRPILDDFIYTVIKEYPYLYVHQRETNYNTIFEKDPKAFVILATKNGKVIGELQANPLNSPYFKGQDYSPEKSLTQIKKRGFNLDKMLYISTFMLAKDERTNVSLSKQMFDKTVDLAKNLGYSQICYDEILETNNHPLKPNPYVPVEPWKELGRNIQSMNVEINMSWPTLQADGKVKNEDHKLAFYVIDLQKKE
jgi:hypothetical protein